MTQQTKRERAIRAIKSALWDNAEAITDQVVEDAFDAAMAIMSEPEPPAEGMLRVRALVGVMAGSRHEVVGWSDFDQYDESEERSRIEGERGPSQFHWIEADVPAYAPPAEVTVKGRVVP